MSGSLNTYADQIIKHGIFDNVTDFNCLFDRIRKVHSINDRGVELTKGDIFEIFSEALLNTKTDYQAEKVWPQKCSSIPLEIMRKLNLDYDDDGWDGIYQLYDGTLATYQSKFKSNWAGAKGLGQFIGVSEDADLRHLISTMHNASPSFNRQKRILHTNESILQNLTKNDFDNIEKWLKQKKPSKSVPDELDEYQIEAVNKIQKEFQKSSRATIIMACGTGKTNIGIEVYKRRKPKVALILVPTIALVKQARADWLKQLGMKVATFQLCSSKDITDKEDAIIVKESELDMRIETNPSVLYKWLKQNMKHPKIIFSTYISSPMLSEAIFKNNMIDYAVFDEAHRTAVLSNKAKSHFSHALYDKNIKIKKRLFMTATRRIAHKRQRLSKVGDQELSVDMDNKSLYGNVCYELSFLRAAREYDCIAKIKVILGYVTSSELNKEMIKLSSTHVDGTKLTPEYLMTQIAIQDAVKRFKVKKIFSFHNGVKAASRFTTTDSPLSIGRYLKDFSLVEHVIGKMSMNERDGIMRNFKNAKKGIISSCQCLTEGVDVPIVDMVAFCDSKSSSIDIVQATGRALRKRGQPKKKYGYVLVPIFIEKSEKESMQEAIEKSNFEGLISVIKAMKEHDHEIAEGIGDLIVSSGRGENIWRKARKKVKRFLEIDNEVIANAVMTKLVENIKTHWDDMVRELLIYKDKFGHMNIKSTDEGFKKLHEWVKRVRWMYQKNDLYHFRVQELDDLGFKWIDDECTLTLNDIKKRKLITPNKFYAKQKISSKVFYDLVAAGKIKSAGIGPSQSLHSITNYYEDISREYFNKNIMVTKSKKLLSYTALAKHLGTDRGIITRMIEAGLLIPEMEAPSSGSRKKSGQVIGLSKFFKPITKDEFKKIIGADYLHDEDHRGYGKNRLMSRAEIKDACDVEYSVLSKLEKEGLLSGVATKVGKGKREEGNITGIMILYPEQTKDSLYNLCQKYNETKKEKHQLKQLIKYKKQ